MIIYIAGTSHSGSTILDVLLGNSSQIESVGELLGFRRAKYETCSCGSNIADCPFWLAVRARLEEAGVSWAEARGLAANTGPSGLYRVWRASDDDATMQGYAATSVAMATAVAAATGKPHILDSSKTPGHALLLLRWVPDAKVIHLVRDPRDLLRSYLWRKATVPILALTALRWVMINWACDRMASTWPDRVVRVRLEDLSARPAVELERIGRAFALDPADLGNLAHEQPLTVGHNVGGNRLRHEGSVRLKSDGGRRALSLPRWLAVITNLLCGPLMWRYDYGRTGHREG